MNSILFSPRVLHALQSDVSCNAIFQKFSSQHQQVLLLVSIVKPLLEKINHSATYKKILCSLEDETFRLASRVKNLLVKRIADSPGRSISPRSQALLPNLLTIRLVQTAYSVQTKIYCQLKQSHSTLENMARIASPLENAVMRSGFSEGERLDIYSSRSFEEFNAIQDELILMTEKIRQFISQFFPNTLPVNTVLTWQHLEETREAEYCADQLDKLELHLQHILETFKQPISGISPRSDQEIANPKLLLFLNRLRSKQEEMRKQINLLNEKVHVKFNEEICLKLENPSSESVITRLLYTIQNGQEKLNILQQKFKSMARHENTRYLMDELLGGSEATLQTIFLLQMAQMVFDARIDIVSHLRYQQPESSRQERNLGIAGLRECLELQSMFLLSLYEFDFLSDALLKQPKEPFFEITSMFHLLSECTENMKQFREHTVPLLSDLSEAVGIEYEDQIAFAIDKLSSAEESVLPFIKTMKKRVSREGRLLHKCLKKMEADDSSFLRHGLEVIEINVVHLNVLKIIQTELCQWKK